MTPQSWPELAQKVADVIRENEVLKWELVKVKDENAKLEQALERACVAIVEFMADYGPLYPEMKHLLGCKEILIRHFKEAMQ